MDEKAMVADALVGVNGELKMFGDMIAQTEDKALKQCLRQIRNQCEMSQEKRMTRPVREAITFPRQRRRRLRLSM